MSWEEGRGGGEWGVERLWERLGKMGRMGKAVC